jgi:hypothetical protein
MRRRHVSIPFLLLLLLAGCTGRSDGSTSPPAPAQTTTAPTVAASPAKPVTAPSKKPAGTGIKTSKAKFSGSHDPRWGTQYAILKSSKLSTRQITYDLIEWYNGKEAVKACAEDGETSIDNDHCVGWYIRNNNRKLRTLTVDPDAPIRMSVLGELKPVDLKTFLSNVDTGSVIRFDIDANRIMKLDHIYLP